MLRPLILSLSKDSHGDPNGKKWSWGISKVGPPSWMNTYFHQRAGANYKKNCVVIDFAQKIRGAAMYAYHRVKQHNQTDVDAALAPIAHQLTEFEDWMTALENATLVAIKQKYAVSDELWHKCLSDIATIKKNATIGMQNAYAQISHDPAIPADILEIMTTLLKHNNINPQSVTLAMADQATIDASPNTLARTILFTESIKNPELIIHTHYIPAKIIFFPRIKDASETEKISYCAHEIQHLICQHAITEMIIADYLTHYCSVDIKEFEQSKEYRDLCKIQEAQAEILAAIKHPDIARHLKTLRKNHYYPDHLFEEHFYSLSTIDMLWSIHGKIQSLITH
jgi:hypothetical protein